MNNIKNHGIDLPDPAVCFDDEGYEPNINDYPLIYNELLRAIQNLDINLFSLSINNLYSQLKPTPILKNQLQSALTGFTLKLKSGSLICLIGSTFVLISISQM